MNVQGYQIEAANVRHGHDWSIWSNTKIPDDKLLMPRVICHATNVIEHPDYVADTPILLAVNASSQLRIAAFAGAFILTSLGPNLKHSSKARVMRPKCSGLDV